MISLFEKLALSRGCDDCKMEKRGNINIPHFCENHKIAFEVFEERRLKANAEPDCEGDGCDKESCQSCCDHDYDADEGYMCLNCGKEGAEEVMSAAYDRAKDLRKYGE